MGLNVLENAKMAFKTLAANKLQSGLTMLGIIIGNASVIAMVAAGEAAQGFVTAQFESLGTNLLFITPGDAQRGPLAGTTQADTLTLADAEAITQEVLAVSAIAPQKNTRLRITQGAAETQANVTGTTPDYQVVRDIQIAQGQFLNPIDVQTNLRVAVLGSETARTLFGNQDPVGRKIRISNLSFTVSGVVEERGSSFGQNQDELVYIPINVMVSQLTGQETGKISPTVQVISISLESPDTTNAAVYQIRNLLRLRHNILQGDDDFAVQSQQELLERSSSITDILVLVLGFTAGISLLVGGIGIMNIMLVSVTERTGEIGLRKAIGATGTDILAQFTIEAVILAATGGMIGIGVGLLGVVGLTLFSPLEAGVSLNAVIVSFTVSGSIGLIFGIAPAQRAANLDPIVALRS
ncbi:ABC transporter permease [Leptothoe sp. ISB3NOV94-8A]|uniref:ABC transporter permease n=1 Tax=Adonisia turfae CCMR0081 TaxID=2292702 RepID=A0A6M0RJL2_9CYAN|nr:ABC transporter permease [Adonisia turfae]MDV3347295.1 ABC transporter permease [Leptothoe sp. LEGE 181152]NEZ56349.1 ABC transporter permease [Adonisia turfae CCMR0081]